MTAGIFISIVIPTFARPDRIARCLNCVNPLRLPGLDTEIIVTDDSPDTSSREMLARDFPQVQWTTGPRGGPAANRNHGASLAKGEWIAFLDDDVEASPGWLAALASATAGTDVVEGKTVCPDKQDHPFEEHVENLTGGNLWSCNMAVRREVFERIGGFDADFLEAGGEDMEFAWRIQRDGLKTRFSPGMLAIHPPRRIGWRGLWRRTLMIRWMALYRLKTGIQTSIVLDMTLDLLRTTLHLFTRFDSSCWRTRLFQQAWKWLTFPFVVPYLVVWQYRFRRHLKKSYLQGNSV
ncbi:MAG: glycosyltransferase [Verrucomicrobiota bacterium]